MSEAAPRISIALCTYNGERFLAQQLESLLAQDHQPLELVACDDGSTDDTWAILQRYAPRFGQAQLVRNTSNLGVHANFQQALLACKAEWIAPCDQDDIWEPHKLSRLLAEAGDALLVYGDSALIDAQGQSLGERVSDRLPMIAGSHPLAFAFGNCVSGHAALLRRSLVEIATPIPTGLYYDEWLAFVASSLGTIVYVDEPLVQFRQHGGNLTQFTRAADARRKSPLEAHTIKTPKLAALAGLPGPQQALLSRLLRLWRGREQQWLSPSLMALTFRHHDELRLIAPRSTRLSAWRFALKHLWGLRAKMLMWRARRR